MLELNTNLLVDLGGWPTLKEARSLVQRGAVTEARQEGVVIRAKVRGAERSYEPSITLADLLARVEVRCTCIEYKRSERVCAHIVAAGLALLQPSPVNPVTPKASASGGTSSSPKVRANGSTRLPYYLAEEAPPDLPRIEITVLLPLQLAESLTRDEFRLILEAKLEGQESTQPWDALAPRLQQGFVVDEPDHAALSALEQTVGSVQSVLMIHGRQRDAVLRSLSGHPRVWIGKKQRVEVRAAAEKAQIDVSLSADGALKLELRGNATPVWMGASMSATWHFQGESLQECPARPSGWREPKRVVTRAEVPDFLAQEWTRLAETCDLILAPGWEGFRLESEEPTLGLHLEGTLAGLSLDIVARYGDTEFRLRPPLDPVAYQRYYPDPNSPQRYWRRNAAVEQAILREIEQAGFAALRSTSASLSLTQEKNVARFLANLFPRWRQAYLVTTGPRLEAAMAEMDFAQPEYTLRSASGNDWLSLDMRLTTAGKPLDLPPQEIQRWLQTGQTHLRRENRRVLLVPTEAWGEMQEVLSDCSAQQAPGQIRVPRAQAAFLSGALAAQGFRTTAEAPSPLPAPDVEAHLPPELRQLMRPYQKAGVAWLAGLAQQQLNGLLADDMGLGKTLQALVFASWLRRHHEAKRPFLIVCPTSLVRNWQREAARFTPELRTLDLTGAQRAERFGQLPQHDLAVTSYALLRRDIDFYRTIEFGLVVLDEAQHIKNRASQNAQSAKALTARHRLVLTGTPLENSVLDLWSLYDFLLPGYLGTASDFKERYETPLTKAPEVRVMERLRHRIRPYFLRRTKEEVLTDLPPKLDFPTLCELTDEQRDVYRAVLAEGRREVFDRSGKSGGGRDRIAVLTTLLRLRQVSCHLGLLPSGDEKRVWKEPSAKMERTFELIDEAIDGGHRVLVFSQFVKALHLLREEAHRRELAFCYLDGQTVNRQGEVDRFQRDATIPLFFISLKAGGTGLNLTGADTVIHFDPWWNPAVEEQATARAHRLGQERRVQAYKLIAAGTVEEKIQILQQRKKELFKASLAGDEAFVAGLSGDDLEELLAES